MIIFPISSLFTAIPSADNISDEHTDRCVASPLANRFIA